MSAESKIQQQATGIAHAVKIGKLPKSKLRGASKQMHESMSDEELKKYAKTKHKGLVKRVQKKLDKTYG